jgi:hypothetical protein
MTASQRAGQEWSARGQSRVRDLFGLQGLSPRNYSLLHPPRQAPVQAGSVARGGNHLENRSLLFLCADFRAKGEPNALFFERHAEVALPD